MLLGLSDSLALVAKRGDKTLRSIQSSRVHHDRDRVGCLVWPFVTSAGVRGSAAQARRLGAGIIGGCCGTTPAQITAIKTAIEEDRAPAGPLVVRERELADAAEAAPEETGLARMLREQEFVVSVQLDPPLGANNSALVEASRALKEASDVMMESPAALQVT